jgi:hypothetical protein
LFPKARVIPKKENPSLRGFDDWGIPMSYCTTYIAENPDFVLTFPILITSQKYVLVRYNLTENNPTLS